MERLPFDRQQTDNVLSDRTQEQVRRIKEQVNQSDIVFGRRLVGINLVAATALVIDHGLGRLMNGWFVCRPNYNAAGGFCSFGEDVAATQPDRTKSFSIVASANCTVDIWVF